MGRMELSFTPSGLTRPVILSMPHQIIERSLFANKKIFLDSSENAVMCTRFIVDYNVIFLVMREKSSSDSSERDQNFLEWYSSGHGVLCYGEELYAIENLHQMNILAAYKESGKAILATTGQINMAKSKLNQAGYEIKSLDRHMLAISLVTEATVLCTRDKKLQDDFQNLNLDGKSRKVYPVSPQGQSSKKEESKLEKQIKFLEQNRCEKVLSASPDRT